MKMEYMISRLEQSRRTAYSISDAVARAAADGWRIHTWTVLDHSHTPNDSNHGHGYDETLIVSVLFERKATP